MMWVAIGAGLVGVALMPAVGWDVVLVTWMFLGVLWAALTGITLLLRRNDMDYWL